MDQVDPRREELGRTQNQIIKKKTLKYFCLFFGYLLGSLPCCTDFHYRESIKQVSWLLQEQVPLVLKV